MVLQQFQPNAKRDCGVTEVIITIREKYVTNTPDLMISIEKPVICMDGTSYTSIR